MKSTGKTKPTAKMTSEDRKAAIVKAVRRLFAEKGFSGTTTRALAEAAGVSEALLFKHFPNKEALFSAMQLSCFDEQDRVKLQKLMAMEPSSSALVLMVHFFVSRLINLSTCRDDDQAIHHRLMLRSLAENGDFARHILHHKAAPWVEKFEVSLQAAIDADEAYPGPVQQGIRGWLVHHLTAMTMIYLLPEQPVVDYGLPREKLIEQLVWFGLRGMGLKEEAIQRYYNPKVLSLFIE